MHLSIGSLGDPGEFFAQLRNALHNSGRFTTENAFFLDNSSHDVYSGWDCGHRYLYFDIERFIADSEPGSGASMLISPLTTALYLMYCFQQEGLHAFLAELRGNPAEGEPMYFNTIRELGKVICFPIAQVHYAVAVQDDEGALRFFDPFLNPLNERNEDILVYNLPFSATDSDTTPPATDNLFYRDHLCETGSQCIVAALQNTFLPGPPPPMPVAGKVRNRPSLTSFQPSTEEGKLLDIVKGDRSFDAAVKKALPLPRSQARCHSVSYKCMEKLIYHALNRAYAEEITRKEALDVLFNVLLAVQCHEEREADLTPYEMGAIEAFKKIEECSKWEPTLPLIAREANLFLENLNNMLVNLRMGDSQWNSSLQDAFDPEQWLHVRKITDGVSVIYKVDSSFEAKNYDAENEPDFPAELPPPAGYGFYLPSKNDSWRLLHLLADEMDPHGDVYLYIAFAIRTDDGKVEEGRDRRFRLMLSSSNDWNIDDDRYDYSLCEPIYVLNAAHDGWQCIMNHDKQDV